MLEQIYVHSPYDTINIAKHKYYATYPNEFLVSAIEIIADDKIQRYVFA